MLFKKPDISFICNGALAGLVAITAGCDALSVPYSVLTGALAGAIVVFACKFFDKIRVDDPVGAISVHGVCGAWGTIAVGLFMKAGVVEGKAGLFNGGGMTQLMPQLIGVGAAFLWSFTVSFAIFQLIKMTVGLRVSQAEEIEGLDIHEHGCHAYPPGFVVDDLPGSPTYRPSPVSAGVPQPVMATEGA
jgi:Amt family ammonium transporter